MASNRVLVSLDMDWAPDELIEDSLALLDQYGVKATLFMTHRTAVDVSRHEVALHPHFKDTDLQEPLQSLMEIFPQATGSRSHSLFFSYRLIDIYERLGIRYQSNVLAYKQPQMAGFQISRKVVEAPIFFMDNIHLQMEPSTAFQQVDLDLEGHGLRVFDFHPIHIYLNTEALQRYEAAKATYQDVPRLRELRNTKAAGIRNLFIELLQYLSREQQRSHAIGDWLAREFQWTY